LADLAEQAARLAKADLVTEMVGEFPELQGLMGGYYARAEGPDAVADAIRDHYKPVGQGDDVPTAPVTVAVSLADKLDSLIHFFAVGERPSGSRDPFALRRAALGVISTIITNDIRLSLNKFFQIVLPEIGYMQGWQQAGKEFAALEAALEASLLSDEQKLKFIMDNPFNVQASRDDAELYRQSRDVQFLELCRLLRRPPQGPADGSRCPPRPDRRGVRARRRGRSRPPARSRPCVAGLCRYADGARTSLLVTSARRISSRSRRMASPLRRQGPTAGVGTQGVELAGAFAGATEFDVALLNALEAAEPKAAAAIEAEDFEGAMAALATLRAPIDAFFVTQGNMIRSREQG
jgi:glycyl-tRNA synthetase beta chain